MEDFDEIAPDRAVVVMTVHQIGIVFPPAFDDFIFRHGKRSFVIGEFTKGEKCIAFFIKENGIIADAALKMFLDEFRPDCSMSAAAIPGLRYITKAWRLISFTSFVRDHVYGD